jgi:hypothetical protein
LEARLSPLLGVIMLTAVAAVDSGSFCCAVGAISVFMLAMIVA